MRGGFSGKRNKIRVTGFDYGLLVTVHTFTMSFGLLPCTIKARGFEHVLLRGGLVKMCLSDLCWQRTGDARATAT